MITTSWLTFTKRIPINADLKKIYEAWSTQEGLERWFLKQSHFTSPENKLRNRNEQVQAGDSYDWLWHGFPDCIAEKRKVLEANGKDFFKFVFTENCLVSIRILEVNNMNIVELTQENIPPDENPKTNLYVACGEGWTFYLANLKSILEGGIDLRNKDEKISGVINA